MRPPYIKRPGPQARDNEPFMTAEMMRDSQTNEIDPSGSKSVAIFNCDWNLSSKHVLTAGENKQLIYLKNAALL